MSAPRRGKLVGVVFLDTEFLDDSFLKNPKYVNLFPSGISAAAKKKKKSLKVFYFSFSQSPCFLSLCAQIILGVTRKHFSIELSDSIFEGIGCIFFQI